MVRRVREVVREVEARLEATPRPVIVGAVVLALVNLTLIRMVIHESPPTDWLHYVSVGQGVVAGKQVYNVGGVGYAGFNYNPLMAYAFALVGPIGYLGWTLLRIGASVLMPKPLGLIALVSFPWWFDAVQGNLLAFLILPAAWAVRGKGWAIATTLVLALLIPRPLVVPLIAWLLWRYPAWRIRFVGIVIVVGAATLATGMVGDWLAVIGRAARDMDHYWNLSPSSIVGLAWLPVGAALALLLLRRGYVGLACLAASPYLLPSYLLFALLDLRPERGGRSTIPITS